MLVASFHLNRRDNLIVSSNDVSEKKRRFEGDDANCSGKGKGRKDEPSFKKKKITDERDDNDVTVNDNNAMQTRIRTGTISKVLYTIIVVICNL